MTETKPLDELLSRIIVCEKCPDWQSGTMVLPDDLRDCPWCGRPVAEHERVSISR